MVRLTDRPDMTLDVYRGRKTTMQQQQQQICICGTFILLSMNCQSDYDYHQRLYRWLSTSVSRYFSKVHKIFTVHGLCQTHFVVET